VRRQRIRVRGVVPFSPHLLEPERDVVDGWDIYRSDHVTIKNSVINNSDDCVSFKPNSTNIVVSNLTCTGSHGISVGSLGQYAGETDIVANVSVDGIRMTNAQVSLV